VESANSLLRLEASFYDKVIVETVPQYQQGVPISLRGDIGVELVPSTESSSPWAVILSVAINAPEEGPTPPYTVDMRAIGHFRWEGDTEAGDEGFERIVGVNGASLLFSGMRELVAIITARGPWGQMLLPTLDFRAIEIVTRPPDTAEAPADSEKPEDDAIDE